MELTAATRMLVAHPGQRLLLTRAEPAETEGQRYRQNYLMQAATPSEIKRGYAQLKCCLSPLLNHQTPRAIDG